MRELKINPINRIQNPYRKQMDKLEQMSEVKVKRDRLEISKIAKELQQSNKIDEERLEKINRLKEEIDAGTYKVDAKAVARKFYEYWMN